MKSRNLLIRKRRKKESLFKYISAILHLWLGLFSAFVIIIVCLTGCMYAFKNQIHDIYNRNQIFVEISGPTLDIRHFEEILSEKNQEIISLVLPSDPKRSWIIGSEEKDSKLIQTNYYNPYTGQNLGSGNGNFDSFFNFIESLHKNLLLGEIGKQIVGAFVLIFIFMLISGLILWWPKRKKKQLSQAFTIKWKAKFYRLNYDLHNTLGFYSLLFLLFLSLTGVYITYPWMKNIVLISLGGESIGYSTKVDEDEVSESFAVLMNEMLLKENEKENFKEEKKIPLDEILHQVQKELNYSGTTILLTPNEKDPRYRIEKINTNNWFKAMLPDFIAFDKKGNLKQKELFKDKPLHQQFKELSKPLHTGEIMGTSSAILYFIITSIGFSLPITGFLIWWKKARK